VACHLVSSSAWHEYVKPKGRRRWEVVRLLIHQRILKPVWMSASATDRHASLDPWTVAVHLVHERPLLADSGRMAGGTCPAELWIPSDRS
jgi:hypothetical protein